LRAVDRAAGPRHGRATLVVVVAGALVGLVGCSDRHAGPPVADARPTSLAPLQSLALSPAKVWGNGRALAALSADDGALSVVTTTGVYHMTSPGSDVTEVGSFDSPTQVGATVLSPDGATLAVAAASPPDVHVYDLVAAEEIDSFQMPLEAAIRSLSVEPISGAIEADTTFGPFVSVGATAAPQPLLEALPTGESAQLPDGTRLTPLFGTATLAVNRGEVTEQHTLDVPEGGSVIDARSSPSGAVIAVTVGVGPDELERKDRILVLEPTSLSVRGVIETDGPLDPKLWTITEDGVVLLQGSTISAWSFDGQQTGTAESTGTPVARLLRFAGGVLAVHADGSLVRWPADSWSPTNIRPGGITLEHVEVDRSGSRVTTVDFFGAIEVWSTLDGTSIGSDRRFAIGETTSVTISGDGSMIGAASSSGRVVVLDDDLGERWSFDVADEPDRVDAVSFNSSGGELVTGLAQRRGEFAFDDTVTMWDPSAKAPRFSVGGEGEDVIGCSFFYSRLRFSPDGAAMAVTSHDFRVIVLDPESGSELHAFPGPTTVLDVAYTPDNELLVATYDNASVAVWSTRDYSQVASYSGPPGGYAAIAPMPDGESMIATDITGTITELDIRTGEARMTFAGSALRSTALALSSDGDVLAAPTVDGGIGLWSTVSGDQLAAAAGHTAPVTGLVFAPDGGWLASSSDDGTIRTWSVETS
jgi:WD40 repeat protein